MHGTVNEPSSELNELVLILGFLKFCLGEKVGIKLKKEKNVSKSFFPDYFNLLPR